MKVTVRLPGALRDLAGGARALDVEVAGRPTVRTLLDTVGTGWPAIERRIRDETGVLRPHVNVFVGDANVRDLGGQDAAISDGDEVHVIPAVSGG
ncbi:MAG TPA: ubiquitin-like small modifier protein 1 [Jiangellaceae bacterium]